MIQINRNYNANDLLHTSTNPVNVDVMTRSDDPDTVTLTFTRLMALGLLYNTAPVLGNLFFRLYILCNFFSSQCAAINSRIQIKTANTSSTQGRDISTNT